MSKKIVNKKVAPVGAGATGVESSTDPDSSFTVALFACLEVSPQVSRARVSNTPPVDFERVAVEERRRQADLLALRRWSLEHGHRLASQARRNRFRLAWATCRWGEAA